MDSTPDRDDLGFRHRLNKDGSVAISRNGLQVTVLRARSAIHFLQEIEGASTSDTQQIMARLTGNYKRGNEHIAAAHPRNLSGL